MKILKLDHDADRKTSKVTDTTRDVFANLNQLVTTYGKQFYVQFRNRRIPFIVKRRLEGRSQKGVYALSIAYTQTHKMNFPTLNMTIGDDSDSPESAYIDYVNRNDEHDLSGTFIVELAITFLTYLGVKEVSLQDAASIDDESNRCRFQLAPYLLLKKNTTFYGKWGFKPLSHLHNTSYEDNKAKQKRLCQIVSRLQKTQIKDMLALLRKTKTTLTTLKDLSKLITYDVMEDFKTGVKSQEGYDDDWDTEKLHELLKYLDKVNNHLMSYQNNTIFEMVQTCTCLEFQSLLQFSGYSYRKLNPGVIVVGKKKIANKYFAIFQELYEITNGKIYVLDLTTKSSGATCP
jgi:hypothetical protein